MYALAMTIDHYYWKQDYKYHHARWVEKEAFKSHSQKQGKASISSTATASQNKANPSPVASPTKNSSSKSFPSPTPKKQPNTPQVNLSPKLTNNGKLTSNKCKKHLKNSLCLYCSTEDHKLDFCPRKQAMVSPKDCGASATANILAAASEEPLEK